MVEQYRHGVDELTLEIPGGAANSGEEAVESAKRELLEETGYSSDEWHPLGSLQANPAFMTNECSTFIALNCKKVAEQTLDPMEDIDVHLIPFDKFEKKMREGEIKHSLVVAAYALLLTLEETISYKSEFFKVYFSGRGFAFFFV